MFDKTREHLGNVGLNSQGFALVVAVAKAIHLNWSRPDFFLS